MDSALKVAALLELSADACTSAQEPLALRFRLGAAVIRAQHEALLDAQRFATRVEQVTDEGMERLQALFTDLTKDMPQ